MVAKLDNVHRGTSGVFDALKAEEETWEGGHGGLAAAARAMEVGWRREVLCRGGRRGMEKRRETSKGRPPWGTSCPRRSSGGVGLGGWGRAAGEEGGRRRRA